VMLPGFLVTMVAGLVAARLGRRFPLRVLVPVGLLLAGSGYVLCTQLGAGSDVAVLTVASVLVGAGIGLSETITNDAILAAAPADRAGSASAVSETAYEIGAVLGTAVLGSVLSAVYRAAVEVPSSVGPIYAAAARETLGGAVGVAQRLTGVPAGELMASARAAFTGAVGTTALTGAAVLVLVALTVFAGLSRPTNGSQPTKLTA
jgi:MFS transporter, DHA2 family, multidrug resistance protein